MTTVINSKISSTLHICGLRVPLRTAALIIGHYFVPANAGPLLYGTPKYYDFLEFYSGDAGIQIGRNILTQFGVWAIFATIGCFYFINAVRKENADHVYWFILFHTHYFAVCWTVLFLFLFNPLFSKGLKDAVASACIEEKGKYVLSTLYGGWAFPYLLCFDTVLLFILYKYYIFLRAKTTMGLSKNT